MVDTEQCYLLRPHDQISSFFPICFFLSLFSFYLALSLLHPIFRWLPLVHFSSFYPLLSLPLSPPPRRLSLILFSLPPFLPAPSVSTDFSLSSSVSLPFLDLHSLCYICFLYHFHYLLNLSNRAIRMHFNVNELLKIHPARQM